MPDSFMELLTDRPVPASIQPRHCNSQYYKSIAFLMHRVDLCNTLGCKKEETLHSWSSSVHTPAAGIRRDCIWLSCHFIGCTMKRKQQTRSKSPGDQEVSGCDQL